ncbi:YihY/virulence factor BrkB family protein [Janibacter indicus]|uniref:Ribonuclease BN n=1 Tax=Janibacter indicus TaxID=857417 RepID=A0A1L3MLN2_9MICO|nr:YihY/virulence factor BrkB family protein [Janibacter indicus]APH03249.1 ribonuclease BN [Janibacter indicus]
MNARALTGDEDHGKAPHPEDDAKADSPAKITSAGWKFTGRKAVREFLADQCTDLAAALTYYAVLAIFPALIAIFSLLGLVGQSQTTIDAVMPVLKQVLGSSGSQTLEPVVRSLATSPGAGLALILGLATALWSASGYVTAFSRAMNRVYEIGEGRPIWKLRPLMLLITLVMVLLVVLVALMLVLSGPAAQAIGDLIGLGSTALTVWSIAKWPVILVLVMLIVAILYYTTPNVQQPKFRWISVGAGIAILVWILISLAFGLYIVNFSNYGSTYGSFAGVVIFLLWLWITNLALLFGAEVDAELERSRQLMAGIEAERDIQLPVRDDTKIRKDEKKEQQDIEQAANLRHSSGQTTDTDKTEDPRKDTDRRPS